MSVGKNKLLVSFSGGETSAYMAQWLWNNKQDEFDMVFVFANTGQENEETLEFIEECSKHFGFPVYWVESEVYHNVRKSSGYKLVDFQSASRIGEPFEDVIKKYGIPNQNFPHCTRELKQNPIKSFGKEFLGEDYYLAIGIRSDEADRINAKAKSMKIIYPLINQNITKQKVNFWWSQQKFRLNLKGYQGNCKTCWKKSDKKLFQIAKEKPINFEFMDRMETKYPLGLNGDLITFFRGNRSASDMIEQSKNHHSIVVDDSKIINYQLDLLGGESCEVWSECGS